jgi:gamma-glutamyltranspeptidase/glutathione hydrolase
MRCATRVCLCRAAISVQPGSSSTLQAALSQLRFHHQLLPENTIFAEPYAPLPAALAQSLTARGFRIENQDYNGDIEAIQVIGHEPVAAADPRARGVAMVIH